MKRGRWLAAIAALTLAGTTLVLVADPGDRIGSASFDARAALQACTDAAAPPAGNPERDQSYIPYNRPCLTAAWDAAIGSGEITTFITELEQVVAAVPLMEVPCHDEAHSAGIRAYATGTDPYELLVAATSQRSVCDNGFVHGLIGAVARDGGTPETVTRIAGACDRIAEPGRLSCVHGSGHAVWSVTRSMSDATGLCATFPEQRDRRNCMSGVLMTILSPTHDPAEAPTITTLEAATEQFPSLCSESDAAGLLGVDWSFECFQPYGEYFINHISNVTISEAEFADRASKGSTACAAMGDRFVADCTHSVYLATFRQLRALLGVAQDRAHIVFCDPLTAGGVPAQACERALNSAYHPAGQGQVDQRGAGNPPAARA